VSAWKLQGTDIVMTGFTHVEKQVGQVEFWPSYVLLHLFVDLPDDVTMRSVNFFFGNGVEKSCAASWYAACNTQGKTHKIIEAVCDCHFKWEHIREEHLASYYNMRTCSLTWINGKELDKEEEVEPKVSVPEIVVECLKTINPEKWSTLKRAIRRARGEREECNSDDESVLEIDDESQGGWIMQS
jgi:hypothetical protein